MVPAPNSPPPPRSGTRWWVYGTSMLSVLCMVIWGIDLLVRGRAPLLYDLTPHGRVILFGILTLLYATILVIRVRIVRVPAAVRPEDGRITIGMVYWILTLPFMAWVCFLIAVWNGFPGV